MRGVCVGTGWYADSKGHNNRQVDPRMQSVNYLRNIWYPHITKQIDPSACVIYQSDCELKAFVVHEKKVTVMQGVRPANQPKHNDAAASMMASAMFAYCNQLDFVFIEQDCLVWGLREAILWARGKDIVYGVTPYSDDLSRGENSFVFISYEYISEFLNIMFRLKWHIWGIDKDFPECIWDDTFKQVGARWPFGYGRKRPINFDLPMFYAQQLTDVELKQFLTLLRLQ